MKKLTASVLAAALVLLSPGLSCYQALAGMTEGPAGEAKVPGAGHPPRQLEKISAPADARRLVNSKPIPAPQGIAGSHEAGAAPGPKAESALTGAESRIGDFNPDAPAIQRLTDPKTAAAGQAQFYDDRLLRAAPEDATPAPGGERGKADGVSEPAKRTLAEKIKAVLRLSGAASSAGTPAAAKSAGREFDELEKLKSTLKAMGLPPYRKIVVEEEIGDERSAAAFLHPASTHKIAVFQELGRQAPGDRLLALDPSWVVTEELADGRSVARLTKGVYFEKDGKQAVLVEYKKPRRVRYFGNFETLGGSDREDGVHLEKNLDAPMSSSARLEKVTNDKIVTRLLVAARGVAVPATMAFLMAAHPSAPTAGQIGGSDGRIRAAVLGEGRARVKAGIEDFLGRYQGAEVVVKPSGPQFHSARGVRIFKRTEIDAMVDHVLALSRHPWMQKDGAILVEERIAPPPVYLRAGEFVWDAALEFLRFWKAGRQQASAFLKKPLSLDILSSGDVAGGRYGPKEIKDSTFRVIVARQGESGAKTSGIFVRAGAWGVPTSAEPGNPEDAAAYVKYEDWIKAVREQHGLLRTDAQAEAFTAELKAIGEKTLLALIDHESKLKRQAGEPYQAQTDLIGLDIMAATVHGTLTPTVIEVNDHDVGGQPVLDLFYPERAGEHSRELGRTITRRAEEDARRAPSARYPALAGKTLLYVASKVGGRDYLYEEVFRLAKREGFGVSLLGYAKDRAYALGLATKWGLKWGSFDYLSADIGNHASKSILAVLKEARAFAQARPVHAVKTYLNAYAYLAAELGETLSLPGYAPKAVLNAHDKTLARDILNAYTEDGRTYPLRVPAFKVADAGEARARFREIMAEGRWRSVVIKPVMGGGGWGVRLNLASEAAVERAIKDLETDIRELIEKNPAKAKSKQLDTNPGIMIEAQIPYGLNGDAELMGQDGRIVFSSLSYNPPAFEGHHERGTTYPMDLPPELQRLVVSRMEMAYRALGLTSGNAHFEFILTKVGGRWEVFLIEANARMGGADVYASIKEVTDVDLMEEGMLLAFGLPIAPKPQDKQVRLQHRFLLAAADGKLKSLTGLPPQGGRVFLSESFVEPGAPVKKGDWLGNITVRASDEESGRDELFKLLAGVKIEIEAANDGTVLRQMTVRQTGLFSHDQEDGRKLVRDVLADIERLDVSQP